MKKLIVTCMLAFGLMLGMTGCSSEASQVNYNLRKEADNFNVRRKLTVFNLRTDTVLFEMEGLFSISDDSDGDLDVTVQTGENEFKQHYVRMTNENCYVVEDITGEGTNVDKYHYEINFLPEWGFKVAHNE